ncbi:MAG: hypothetical protein ACKO9D_03245 [Gammaproteobacteria bacterium]
MNRLLLASLLVGCVAAASAGVDERPRMPAAPLEVLFVGNSLIFVGNTPAVFDALTRASGRPSSSDMIVQGGATLADRVADGSVERAFARKRYAVLVLQERGGDLDCSIAVAACHRSRQAISVLVGFARQAGAAVYLLGTYQGHPHFSKGIVVAESAAASDAGSGYLEVSESLQRYRTEAPDIGWHAPDGMHPGPALALLNAVLLHRAVLGAWPQPDAFTVDAPIYSASSGLTPEVRGAADPSPNDTTPRTIDYPAETLRRLLKSVVRSDNISR